MKVKELITKVIKGEAPKRIYNVLKQRRYLIVQ